jgi:muramoyltetrapeptide carboxypeptidase
VTSSTVQASDRSVARRRRVRIVAPSSPFAPERLARGVERLRSSGFVVDVPAELLQGTHPYLNGSDDVRALALDDGLSAEVDIVWLARGGYGLTRIIDRLADVDVGTRPLPLVIGFSDATALIAALFKKGVRSIHGPLATTLADENETSFAHLISLIDGEAGVLHTHPLVAESDVTSRVSGLSFAANLNVLTHLVGTPSMPSLAGTILFVEDVGERPYRLDRMFTQLLSSGALAGVRAVVTGVFEGCEEPASTTTRAPLTALDVVRERAAHARIPLYSGMPFGHTSPNFAIPVGVPVTIESEGGQARVHVDEGLVSLRCDA